MKKAKRLIAAGLAFIMLFSTLPELVIKAAGVADTDDSAVPYDGTDISSSSVFDALGIDTSVIPEGVDLNSTDNPYGRNTFTQVNVSELLLQGSTYAHLFAY